MAPSAGLKKTIYENWSTAQHQKIITGYLSFKNKQDAKDMLNIITQNHYKLLIHITRYGNFNNVKLLKNMNFSKKVEFTKEEIEEINSLVKLIKY